MYMKKIIIEDLLWKNVFEQPICEYIKYFVIMIVVFRILSLFRLTKQAKTMVYLIKSFSYGLFIILLFVYFRKTENSYENINVLTGFTFLFCVVEVTDNFMQLIEEIFAKRNMHVSDKKMLLQKEEKSFCDLIRLLQQIQNCIKPGKLDKDAKEQIQKLVLYTDNISFYTIDSFIQMTIEKEYYCSELVGQIRTQEVILRILEESEQESFLINVAEYNKINELIEKIVDCQKMYYEEKKKYELVKKNLQYI